MNIRMASNSASTVGSGSFTTRMSRSLKLLTILLSASCAATFDADAELSCHQIFEAWDAAAKGCGLEATMPDPNNVCWRAYAVDEDNLNGCLGWIRSQACDEYDNAHFQAHCGEVISLRTW